MELKSTSEISANGPEITGSMLKAVGRSPVGRSPTIGASKSRLSKRQGWREVHVAIYPGVNVCGISAWVFDAKVLRSVAVGSISIETLPAFLLRLRPDSLRMESTRQGPLSASPVTIDGVRDISFAHPGWRNDRVRMPNVPHPGPHAANAYAIGYHELFRRGDYALSTPVLLEALTPEWLDAWSVT